MRPANFMTKWSAVTVLALAATLVSPALAQHDNNNNNDNGFHDFHPPPQNQYHQGGPGHAGDWLRRYKNVPPGEQERALQSDPAFRRLSPERQQMLRERLQHFSSLPPQQQQRMLDRMETWEHLTPEQKQQAREIHGQLQQLPPDRRGMVTTAVRHL